MLGTIIPISTVVLSFPDHIPTTLPRPGNRDTTMVYYRKGCGIP